MDQAEPEDQVILRDLANAVLIQIWTAMIAYLLLLWLKVKSRLRWSILELTRLVQNLIMERQNFGSFCAPERLIDQTMAN